MMVAIIFSLTVGSLILIANSKSKNQHNYLIMDYSILWINFFKILEIKMNVHNTFYY